MAVDKPATADTGHRDALDGIRAIAILVVMFVHAGTPGFKSGWIGVDLFFVLSGFLITTLLAAEIKRTRSLNWRAFMVRRALRLVPAYLVYISIVTACIWWWPGSERTDHGGWSAGMLTAALWTYTINFAPQGGIWNGQELTIHLWSLAVEQQYYLVWPFLMLLFREKPRALLVAATSLGLAFLVAFVLAPPGMMKNAMLFTRGFSIVLGSAAALVFAETGVRAALPRGLAPLFNGLGLTGLAALAITPYWPGWPEDLVRERFLPLIVPAFALWVGRLWYGPVSPRASQVLRHPGLIYLGKVSYGIYLYHEAVRVLVWHFGKPLMVSWPLAAGYLTRTAVYLIVSVLLAAASYEWIEKRFLQMSGRFRPQGPSATT